MKKRISLWMGLILIFTLLTSGIQAPVMAADGTKQGTLTVIGTDTSKPILPETTVEFSDNESASEALVKAIGENNVVFTHYSFGDMVTGINGLNADDSHYWAFYINGEASMEGAGTYLVKDGDKLGFRYESFGPAPGDNSGTGDSEKGQDTNPSEPAFSDALLKASLESASKYVLKQQIGEWEVIALKQAGINIPANYLENVRKIVKDANGIFRKITDTERYSLGILAAGGDPANFEGHNLIDSIYNGDVTKQGLNGVAYALITLDSANFKVPDTARFTKEKLIQQLLEKQNLDGGWTWDVTSTISDIDTTGMVLAALAPYKEQAGVKEKVNSALNYLTSQFKNGKIDNSSSAAQVIIALSALGIDANGPQFTKDQHSLVQFLLTFQNTDGGFDYQGGDTSDPFSTTQGYMGIVAYQLFVKGKGSLFTLPLSEQKPAPTTGNPGTQTDKVTEKTNSYPLPDTASSDYNLLLIGVLIMMIGTIIFLNMRGKRVKN